MEINPHLSPKAIEDMEIIRKATSGDEKAYAKLLSRYRKSVFYLVLKMVNNKEDAEDLTLEAFTKAFRSLEDFNPEYAFSTWLFRIATNNCIDFIRRQKMKMFSLDTPSESSEEESPKQILLKDSKPLPDDMAAIKQKGIFLRSVVDTLPDTYRTLIELRYYQEYTYEEIAEMLDMPLGTVKAQLHRARELMLKAIEGKEEYL